MMRNKKRFIAGKSEEEPKSFSDLISDVYSDNIGNKPDALDLAVKFGSIEDVLCYQMSDY